MPLPPLTVSDAPPAFTRSAPLPPFTRSLPPPPWSVSFPSAPFNRSSPFPPVQHVPAGGTGERIIPAAPGDVLEIRERVVPLPVRAARTQVDGHARVRGRRTRPCRIPLPRSSVSFPGPPEIRSSPLPPSMRLSFASPVSTSFDGDPFRLADPAERVGPRATGALGPCDTERHRDPRAGGRVRGHVESAAARQHIVAEPARQRVVAAVAGEGVVERCALDVLEARQRVGPGADAARGARTQVHRHARRRTRERTRRRSRRCRSGRRCPPRPFTRSSPSPPSIRSAPPLPRSVSFNGEPIRFSIWVSVSVPEPVF